MFFRQTALAYSKEDTMKFREVGEQSLKDPRFARELSEAVLRARRDGIGSEAWKRLAQHFAENDNELKLLIPPITKVKGGKFEPETLATLITLSDTFTGTTTTDTTTTTSRLCSLPGICKRATARKKSGAKAGTRKRK